MHLAAAKQDTFFELLTNQLIGPDTEVFRIFLHENIQWVKQSGENRGRHHFVQFILRNIQLSLSFWARQMMVQSFTKNQLQTRSPQTETDTDRADYKLYHVMLAGTDNINNTNSKSKVFPKPRGPLGSADLPDTSLHCKTMDMGPRIWGYIAWCGCLLVSFCWYSLHLITEG